VGTEDPSRFYVKRSSLIVKEDFSNLPIVLQEDWEIFESLLEEDPYAPESLVGEGFGIGSHDLKRELIGYRALEIDYLGEAYRMVYKITDIPNVRRVDVYSFDRHNAAYDKAKNRALGRK
jgi:mRNA interferase RelE/StbE